jgi:Trk K+ transport system NAD-binding subunit
MFRGTFGHCTDFGNTLIAANVAENIEKLTQYSLKNNFDLPSGSTVIEQADILLVLANNEDMLALQKIISAKKV